MVIWTDHGEQFREHGEQGHTHTLYQEESAALALFHSAGLAPGIWEGPTTHIDLLPTIFQALALTPTETDLSGVVLGDRTDSDPRFLAAATRNTLVQAVEQGPWKLHYRWDDGSLTLHDDQADSAELTDVAASHPDQVDALWALLEPEVIALEALAPDLTPAVPAL